ncbi:MAG: methionine adenosyltransferase [Nitrososphaerota archaeon]|nr:methionine adenosyltransferase [Nitrososphaerota archaeon]MDG6977836.1 methionine adenosyltransferase [Nitrososphaerota archaeon]MDG7020669.1 methionine adenosyltransferase [Nitrososphaerota archaeon]
MRTVHSEQLPQSVSDLEVEIVERKGLGHPDSIIDGACEAVSIALSKYYLDNFDVIFHHNVDKGLLVGGKSEASFGGGKVTEPIFILVAGRATDVVPFHGKDEQVPVATLAKGAIAGYIEGTMRFLDPKKHTRVDTMIRPGSRDLVDVFLRKQAMPIANDTSIGVGFAPLSPTENVVFEVEQLLNSAKFKTRYPAVGEDVKVMGMRVGKKLNVTVAAAMVGGKVKDAGEYKSIIDDVRSEVDDLVAKSPLDVNVRLNQADDAKHGSYYLTVTGTSAEQGDDGNTGRGNRVNGLISPMRQYSMEATAGKNPVNHTGKLYNAVALQAAEKIAGEVKGVREAYVRILSRIGSPIDQPQIASAAVVLEKGTKLSAVKSEVEGIIDDQLADIRKITKLILEKRIILF